MNLIDWLFLSITVSRRLSNSYYVIMLIISLIAISIAYKMRYKRFSLNLWLIAGLICLFWEAYLFSIGSRNYNFHPAFELIYHALTEAGPGLIIMILFADKIKLIDISEYSDDYTPEDNLGHEKTPLEGESGEIGSKPRSEDEEKEEFESGEEFEKEVDEE